MTSPDAIEDRAERGPRSYAPHTRVSILGDLGTAAVPVEHWNINLNFATVAGGTGDRSVLAAAAANAWVARATTKLSQNVILRAVKVSDIDAAGKVIGNPNVTNSLANGTDTTRVWPPQTSLVASLGTGVRGATKRGRVYIPIPTGLSLDASTFTLDPTQLAGCEASFVQLIADLRQALGAAPLVIASSKGYNTNVTNVRFGRVLDTMRSRRRSLKETYDVGTTLP